MPQPKYVLRVTYRVRIDQAEQFERILLDEVVPLAKNLGIQFQGVWRTLVGNVGEYLELWEFDSLAEFETKWKALFEHPEFKRILQITGPMVEEERMAILQRVTE
ncbi:MAG: NIPSNAP family protein [Acidobacteriota bacterium]|nr:MAG: NIPSNAP family protein [Acidobacteriota bacterium]